MVGDSLRRLGRWIDRARGSNVSYDLEPYRDIVAAVNAAEAEVERLDDATVRSRGVALRERLAAGQAADGAMLVEILSLVREAARRSLGQRPYDEQVIAGAALHRGAVVEMHTGEGKTLAAVAPAALNGLTGSGSHVLTFNDYLARRDAAWMGPVFGALGLQVGCVQEGMSTSERRDGYASDVTYVTAREAGFDHLRDFLALQPADLVHRPFHFAIVDEADSLLVDEARIPLVIAGNVTDGAISLVHLAEVVRTLRPVTDYDTDEYSRNVSLTEVGIERAESLLGCHNLYADSSYELLVRLGHALHAEALLRRDVDYIVRDGRVELVDEHTGRVADQRHWPDGLQAAVEAKEGVRTQPEGAILGSMTMQHFLRSYPRLAGMTATARPAAAELETFYGLEVVVIPTHRPCLRLDHDDLVFTHRQAKRDAVVDEISRVHSTRRPVLVGTASVAESEELASHLVEIGVECQVLNAANDELEAEIVAEAGGLTAVTISTNMAGRGTDIRLGGRHEEHRDEVVALGGLYVIGTQRHASRRIDDQLRGRAGRQGDPGSSRFFTSLDDDLMQRFGLAGFLPGALVPPPQDQPVDQRVLLAEIARTQRVVEGQDFETRKTLWRYADVIEAQRTYLQTWRQRVLCGEAELDLLASRCADRLHRLQGTVGPEVMHDLERRLTLLLTDRAWSDYLAEIARVRDGVHIVTLGGKEPYEVFHTRARSLFESMLEGLDESIVAAFESLEITADGVDWERAGLRGPSSTWTYMVTDRPFDQDPLASLVRHPTAGIYAAVIHAPLLIAWGLWRLLRRRLGRRS